MQETYHQFVSKAAQGRKMPHSELEKRAQGRVYTGRMAKNLGLVDETGTLHDAIAEAKKAAGLKPDEQVELLILPKPRSIFEQLFGGDSLSGELDAAAPELFKTLRQAKLWRRLFAEPTLLWMPYGMRLR
jgi:protease-4